MTRKDVGYVELEWTCRRCGTKNPGTQRKCVMCGAPMEESDQFELPDQQELITDEEQLEEAKHGPDMHCPYCAPATQPAPRNASSAALRLTRQSLGNQAK